MGRFQLSVRREPGQVIQTFPGHLRPDVDPLDTALGEVFDRGCSLHRGHRSTFAHRLAQFSQPSSVAARVDDRRHPIAVLGLERFDDVAGGAIDHLVGAQAFHVFGLGFARDADYTSASGGCQLDGIASDSSRGSDDHDNIVGPRCGRLD